MNKKTDTIISKKNVTSDTFILQLKPQSGDIFSFNPGQYAKLYNPAYLPEESHPYSIASSPSNKNFLEFCVKIYGDWTQELSKIKEGDMLEIEGPFGEFYWTEEYANCVLLVGGIGISTFMSMLRYIEQKYKSTKVTLLYGNRTENTIVYRDEIESILSHIGVGSKVVHILSHLKPDDKWDGYRGFITSEIITKEVINLQSVTFFIVGPPVFIELMNKTLNDLNVDKNQIKQESLA